MKKSKSKKSPKSEKPTPVIPPRPSGKPRNSYDDGMDRALFRSIHKTMELDLMDPAVEAEARAALLLLKHRGYAIGDLHDQIEDCVACVYSSLMGAWELNPYLDLKAELDAKSGENDWL